MNEFESAFLCGLLNKFRPKKILELGVAGGATTAIILRCLEKIGQPYVMNSIDISEDFHLDKNFKTGSLALPTKENLKFGTHNFYFNTVIPFKIEEIGGDIDFVILDTAHVLPGEVLDFLIVLPYLSENAVVCLHDVSECQRVPDFEHFPQHATTALFSAVTADKFLNFVNLLTNEYTGLRYPNIAAFQINADTMKNIESVFLTLIMRWRYLPENRDLNGYMDMLMKLYPQNLFLIFQEALRMNVKNLMAEAQANAAQR